MDGGMNVRGDAGRDRGAQLGEAVDAAGLPVLADQLHVLLRDRSAMPG